MLGLACLFLSLGNLGLQSHRVAFILISGPPLYWAFEFCPLMASRSVQMSWPHSFILFVTDV